jgi:DNA-binding NarL/FixJ family response regulator
MNILVAVRHGLIAASLAGIVQRTHAKLVVTHAATMADVERSLDGDDIDLLVVSTDLLDHSPTAMYCLTRSYPSVAIAALCIDDDYLAIDAYRAAGAAECLGLNASPAEFVAAIRSILEGGKSAGQNRISGLGSIGHLTGRQTEVLDLLRKGQSTKQIARTLKLAVPTVKVHLSCLYRALGARNRIEAVVLS